LCEGNAALRLALRLASVEQRGPLVGPIGIHDPNLAVVLLWRFLDLASSMHDLCACSDEAELPQFHQASADLGKVACRAFGYDSFLLFRQDAMNLRFGLSLGRSLVRRSNELGFSYRPGYFYRVISLWLSMVPLCPIPLIQTTAILWSRRPPKRAAFRSCEV
jgi:hypothetical protein